MGQNTVGGFVRKTKKKPQRLISGPIYPLGVFVKKKYKNPYNLGQRLLKEPLALSGSAGMGSARARVWPGPTEPWAIGDGPVGMGSGRSRANSGRARAAQRAGMG